MSWTRIVRTLLGSCPAGHTLTELEARQLFAAMLDGGVDDLELGASLAVLHARGPSPAELAGFHGALGERQFRLAVPPAAANPVVIASHAGTTEEANLLPLLALSLCRLGVPVLMHGALNGDGRATAAYVLRELGVMPCANLAQVQERLDESGLAYVPTGLLAPGLATLLALKSRLGSDDVTQLTAKLLDPFSGAALLVVAYGNDRECGLLRGVLCEHGCSALLFKGTEGEAFASPHRRPALECIRSGIVESLFDAESGATRGWAVLPPAADVRATARYTRSVLEGRIPLPLPLVNQIACCLYGAGYTEDLIQAKAIVAVESGSLATA